MLSATQDGGDLYQAKTTGPDRAERRPPAPWSGELPLRRLCSSSALHDPDRTSRVRVNPLTGEIVVSELGTPTPTVHRPVPSRGGPLTLDLQATALVATAAAALGATVGVMLTLALLS